ncbi:MAG: AraC family transcriptional regulator [Haliea sp.]|nr:MAG: AraC family transcriptional regulator [Haliea sp.]
MAPIDYHRHSLQLEALTPATRAQEISRFATHIRVFDYCTAAESLAPHGGDLSIKLVLHGAERFHTRAGSVELRSGEALLMPAGSSYASAISQTTHTFSAFFPAGLCRELAQGVLSTPLAQAQPASLQRMAPLPTACGADMSARLAHARWSLQAQDWERAAELLQEAALRLVATDRELRLAHARLHLQRPAARRELLRRLERCRSVLHDRVAHPVTLEQLADIAQLSRFHLLRGFRDAFGCTPSQYQGRLRLELARERLRSSHTPVAEVARSLGYRNHSAFTRAWRRYFGDTPSSAR